MKKTISVNIKGINFMIEEDAYERLDSYLQRLETQLRGQEGAKDILEDIELRVAELCQAIITDKKSVIERDDILEIIQTLGEPEDFLEEEQAEEMKQRIVEEPHREKRLYRDLDRASLAGVCSGISNYLHIDVFVVRLLFLLFFFIGGFGIPLYIILWVVMPKTQSTIDRLKMKGKPITVENVREEVENAANRMSDSSKSFANRVRKDGDYSKRLSRIGNFVTKLVAIGLIGLGLFFLTLFLIFIFGGQHMIGIESDQGILGINDLAAMVMSSPNDVFLAWLAIGMGAFSVILLFFSNGAFILMKLKNKWTRMSSILLFVMLVVASIIGIFVVASTSKNWVSQAELEREVYTWGGTELIIESEQNNSPNVNGYIQRRGWRSGWLYLKGGSVFCSGVEVDYRLSKDTAFHVYQNQTAHGTHYNEALNRAKHIKLEVKTQDNKLILPAYYHFPEADKFRAQEVRIIIEIPKDKWLQVGNERFQATWTDFDLHRRSYIRRTGDFDHWEVDRW